MTKLFEDRGDRVELIGIEGEQLSAVTFVQDYVQLHFDGPLITAITRPAVVLGEERFEFGAAGYRDRLCGQIAKIVARAYVQPADRLQIEFVDASALVISLKPESYRGPEAAMIKDPETGEWDVW